ncbi:MAG TPA: ATP-binding protein [Gemmatimonadales bacterium]|nr:ATP-binding protein [Gemmatimonadales bacterium]
MAAWRLWHGRQQAATLTRQRDELAAQLERRMGELFSLQELSYVLSESLQVDRLAEQVARYVQRFLRADGALVALAEPGGAPGLRVAGAEGSLAALLGRRIAADDESLLLRAAARERIELEGGAGRPVTLMPGVEVDTAAAAPLRAQGVTMGVVAAAGRPSGAFSTEDLWVLSTAATHTAVALANSRLFELVHRGKAEWEAAFDALAEGLAVVDHSGMVVRANLSLGRILDRELVTLVGQPFAPMVAEAPAAVAELVARPGGVRAPPLVIRSPDRGRMLRLTAARAGDTPREGLVVVLVEDVTEQRAIEGQLIQSEKMAAVGQLVSGVAHELNNPLTSIAGLSELLLEQATVAPDAREHLRVIQAQAERAGRIVQNLLTFARKGTAERTPTDLNDVAGRTALLIAYELRLKGITLDERLAPGPLLVMADRYELQQVALNLLTNAVQAVAATGAAHGTITLETAVVDTRAVLRVSDSGAGVPPEHRPLLFTPFFTTKEPGEGTGLGLSISYGIIDAHGGRLEYAPAPGGGATFSVILPRLEAPAPSPRRILLVDDDPKNERLVAALFAREGHQIEAVTTAETALERVATRSYDLLVVDARMSTHAGSSLVAALRDAHPGLERRLLAAVPRGARAMAERLRTAGHPVVHLPFDLRELRTSAEAILGQ